MSLYTIIFFAVKWLKLLLALHKRAVFRVVLFSLFADHVLREQVSIAIYKTYILHDVNQINMARFMAMRL